MTQPRFRTVSILALCALAMTASAAETPKLSFEVASVKMSAPLNFGGFGRGGGGTPPRIGVKINAGRIDIAQTSLLDVILAAWRLKSFQLTAPDWVRSTAVDIVATLPAGATEGQIPEMLQTLLTERFKLKIRHEPKDQPVYYLVKGKSELKLKESVADPDAPVVKADPNAPDFGMMSRMGSAQMSGDPSKGMVISGVQSRGTMRISFTGAGLHIESSSVTMSGLAEDLSQYMDRPVFDKTGLTGNYVVGLDASMEDMRNFMMKQNFPGGPPPGDFGGRGGGGNPFAGADSDPGGSSIMASLQRLGLKLEPQKASMDSIVVESMEKAPSEN